LSKALAHTGIHTTSDIIALLQSAQDALTYQDDYSIVKPLLIGHKNQLRVLKFFATYHEANGSPIPPLGPRNALDWPSLAGW